MISIISKDRHDQLFLSEPLLVYDENRGDLIDL